jgi:hypothetical protein
VESAPRHLGREPKRSDGITEASLKKCERRLGVRLPTAVRDYYAIAGRLNQLNKAHNVLFALDELRVGDGYLWFMEENQSVAHWGLPVKRLTEDDPIVYQRTNVDDAKWDSEKTRFSTFLIRMFDRQAGFAEAPA